MQVQPILGSKKKNPGNPTLSNFWKMGTKNKLEALLFK
jgi:hypothetical protein